MIGDFILILAAYLIGGIPTGVLVTRLTGAADPRTAGSGNIGATNVMRTAGTGAGIITLVLDVFKGMLPIFIARYFFNASITLVSLAAFAVFLGHVFPVFLGFRGGKGVATALGIFLSLALVQAVIALVLFAVVVWTARYVSVGSIFASLSIIILLWFSSSPIQYVYLSMAISLLLIIRHSGNIKRLINGEENKIG